MRQRAEVTGADGLHKALDQRPVFVGGRLKARSLFQQILLGVVIIPPTVGLRFTDDARDLAVRIIEDLAQQEHRPLDWRQSFQYMQKG